MAFQVIPIPDQVADEVRRTGRAPGYGHPAQNSIASASGYGPCRLCLRRTRQGEARTLFSYNPFPEPEEVSVVGPVFIHQEPCGRFAGAGFPEDLRGLPMVLRGHLRGGAGLVNRRLDGRDPDEAIETLFKDPEIAFISIQNEEAGCFIARVDRA